MAKVELVIDDSIIDGYVRLVSKPVPNVLREDVEIPRINNVSYALVSKVLVNSDYYHEVLSFYTRHNNIHSR